MEELTTVPRSFSLLPRHHPLDLWHHVRGASFAPSPHLHKCSRAHRAQCNALGKEYIATAIITYCHILSEKKRSSRRKPVSMAGYGLPKYGSSRKVAIYTAACKLQPRKYAEKTVHHDNVVEVVNFRTTC